MRECHLSDDGTERQAVSSWTKVWTSLDTSRSHTSTPATQQTGCAVDTPGWWTLKVMIAVSELFKAPPPASWYSSTEREIGHLLFVSVLHDADSPRTTAVLCLVWRCHLSQGQSRYGWLKCWRSVEGGGVWRVRGVVVLSLFFCPPCLSHRTKNRSLHGVCAFVVSSMTTTMMMTMTKCHFSVLMKKVNFELACSSNLFKKQSMKSFRIYFYHLTLMDRRKKKTHLEINECEFIFRHKKRWGDSGDSSATCGRRMRRQRR